MTHQVRLDSNLLLKRTFLLFSVYIESASNFADSQPFQEEKRKRILDAAIQEFATHSFDNSSIAQIIEQAGIPRGSFYQYFADLKDLYKYSISRR